MSRYVNKKHGLIIGSGNIFFITHDTDSPNGVSHIRDGYRAIVWTKEYDFDQVTSVNVFIRTAVQQLLWIPITEEVMEKFGSKEYPVKRTHYVLTGWAQRWLRDNVGEIHDKWDVRTKSKFNEAAVFFKRRRDALAFTRAVEEVLKGMKYA